MTDSSIMGDPLHLQIKSLSDSGFKAKISSDHFPAGFNAYQWFDLIITVRNTGDEVWPSRGLDGGPIYQVNLGYYWLDQEGKPLESERTRIPLPRDLNPGESLEFEIDLVTPGRPGAYHLIFELVQEGVNWFGDRDQQSQFRLPVEVSGPSGPETGRGEGRIPFSQLEKKVHDFHSATQPEMVKAIAEFNRSQIAHIHELVDLRNRTVLEIGCSLHYHGFYCALSYPIKEIVGINNDPRYLRPMEFEGPLGNVGKYLHMDGTQLAFRDSEFDLVFTLSTLEHVLDLRKLFQEVKRVLKEGGYFYSFFEPVWSSPEGHHCHFMKGFAGRLHPWEHLIHSDRDLQSILERRCRDVGIKEVEDVVRWIYRGSGINRLICRDYLKIFNECGMTIIRLIPIYHMVSIHSAKAVSRKLGGWLLPQELLIKGYEVMFQR